MNNPDVTDKLNAPATSAPASGWVIDWKDVIWHMLMISISWVAVGFGTPGSLGRAFALCVLINAMICHKKRTQSPNEKLTPLPPDAPVDGTEHL